MLHWVTNSLVMIKKVHSKEAILALDVGVLDLTTADGKQRLSRVHVLTTPQLKIIKA